MLVRGEPYLTLRIHILASLAILIFLTAVCMDLANSELAVAVPVYTIFIVRVNLAFDSVYHKLDLSGPSFGKVHANFCTSPLTV